jgi:hypothetical protein
MKRPKIVLSVVAIVRAARSDARMAYTAYLSGTCACGEPGATGAPVRSVRICLPHCVVGNRYDEH